MNYFEVLTSVNYFEVLTIGPTTNQLTTWVVPADTSGYFAMCFTSVVVLRLALVRVSLQDEEAARAMDVLDVDG